MLSSITNRFQNLVSYLRPSAANSYAGNQDGNSHNTSACYRYFPNSEQGYFADNFILGSEKFETLHPETFLFGENNDLNFLNPEPLQVPFNLSMELSPVYPIRSLIHVRRDTIRLVRNPSAPQSYRIEFFFDCDVPVEISLCCLVRESFSGSAGGPFCHYSPVNDQSSTSSPAYNFPTGGAQLFSKCDWSFTPGDWPADSWLLSADPNSATLPVPIVVRCRTVTPSSNNGENAKTTNNNTNNSNKNKNKRTQENQQQQQQQLPQQEHIVLIGLDRSSIGDGSFHLKTVRQKLIDNGCGCVFLLHELYGAENKQINSTNAPSTTVLPVAARTSNATSNSASGDSQQTAAEGQQQGSSETVSSSEATATTAGTVNPPPAPAVLDDNISELDDSAGECVVCMSSERDTVLLPCRHLCVCATCAESLRSQCADCPICRLPFKALLRLRAVRPADPAAAAASASLLLSTTGIDPSFALSSPSVMSGPDPAGGNGGAIDAIGENVPPGYESVSLMEALYGAYAANWRKSRPSTSVQAAPKNSSGETSSFVAARGTTPMATQSMATPKPTRQTPVFGRQQSADNAEDGTEISRVNLAYNNDSSSSVA